MGWGGKFRFSKAICSQLPTLKNASRFQTLARHYITADLSLYKGENVVQNEMPVCSILLHSREFKRAVEMWPSPDAGLPNMVGRHKELPRKTIPMCTAWPFPQKPVMLCRNGKKSTVPTFIDFYDLLVAHFWVGEGKDPKSLEDCGGEVMLLRCTNNKTRLQKSGRGQELPLQPKDSIKCQARKEMVAVMVKIQHISKIRTTSHTPVI